MLVRAVVLLLAAALLPPSHAASCSLSSLPAGSLSSVSSACGSAAAAGAAACTSCFPEVSRVLAGIQSSAELQACINSFSSELLNAGAQPATLALLPACTALGTANGVQLLPCPLNLTAAAAQPLASSCASSSEACRGCMGATKTALLDAGLDPQLGSSLILNRAHYNAVQSCTRSFMPLLLSTVGVPAATLMALRNCPVPPTQYLITGSLVLDGVRAADVSTTAVALTVTKILGAVSGQAIVTGAVDAGARRSLLAGCTITLSVDADTAAQQTRFQTALTATVADGSLLRELVASGVPATSLTVNIVAAAAVSSSTGHGATSKPTPVAAVSAATPAPEAVDKRVVAGAVAGSVAGTAPLVALAVFFVLRRNRAHRGRASNTDPLLAAAGTGSTKSSPQRSDAAASLGSEHNAPSIVVTTDTGDSERGWTAVVSTADEVELGETLGAGGFATVYAAVWRGSTVAVKLFDPATFELTSSESSVSANPSADLSWPTVPDLAHRDGPCTREVNRERTFMQEVSMLSKIRHPNVLAIYAMVHSPRMLIMELAPGGSLRALLARSSLEQLPWPVRVRVLTGIAAGVEFLHTQAIIHFDLKSENILMMTGSEQDLVPKVADFSISARKGAAGGLTSAGTPAFMAPEVARGELIHDWEAVDAYGFGCIVHDTAHANTGGPGVVIDEARSTSLLNGIQVLVKRELAGYERAISPHVPPELAALASACLNVSPAARPRLAVARMQLSGMQQQANAW